MKPASSLEQFHHCPRCGAVEGGAVSIKEFVCRACGFQFFSNTAAAVMAFIRNDRGEILFTRRARDPAKGTLDLPGGFVDPMESAEAALAREVREELGLEVQTCRYVASFPNRYDYAGVSYYTTDLAFVCTVADFGAAPATDEIQEILFLPPERVTQDEIGLGSVWEALQVYLRQDTQ